MSIDMPHLSSDTATWQLAAIVESSDDAIVSKDLNGLIVSWNRGAERLFGYTPEEVIGKSITIIIPPDYQHEEPEILRRIRRGEQVDHYETVRQRKDGSLVDISLTVSPVKDREGNVVGASKIARDISERKRAEEERQLLMRELSHRSKNLLALVQGIMQQSIAFAPDMASFKADFGKRLQGLAQSHDLLVVQNWRGAPIATLVHSQLSILDAGDSISIDGPEILLTPVATQNLGMAFHELATNSVKYGALSVPEGHIEVNWKVAGDSEPRLFLTWTERNGPRVAPPKRRGMGHRVLEDIIEQSFGGSASLAFRPEGLAWQFEAPLARVSAHARPAQRPSNVNISQAIS